MVRLFQRAAAPDRRVRPLTQTSMRVPPTDIRVRLTLFASLLALIGAGCGYGTLTTWEENSNSSDAPSEQSEAPSFDSDPFASPAEACTNSGGPVAGDAPARLLTSYEYRNTVRDLLGYDGKITEEFPSENKVNGFENNADAHTASKLQIRKYMKAAEEISRDTTSEGLGELLPCNPAAVGELECGRQFIEDFLRRAYRRPPTDGEVSDYVDLLKDARSKWSFVEGIQLVIQSALQSPQFLYRLNLVSSPEAGTTTRLDGYDIATRLSYFLWATTPDVELMEAAEEGRLQTAEQIEAQARRMLESPRAESAVYQFHRQWLRLDDLDSVVKDAGTFPAFEPDMTDGWRKSMRKFVLDTYFSEDGNVDDLLTSQQVFLTDSLAPVYGKDEREPGIDSYQFDSERRSGLLTQPSLMALLANANQSSPIRRGVWVRERLLCQHLPPPPADANITPPDPDPDASTRERFRQHTQNPQCAGCHAMIDPIGFGFSHYDSMGRWRARDSGRAVDASGELAKTGEAAIEGEFDGASELARRLADSRTVKRCLARRWFTYAMGRPPTDSENCALRRIQRAFDEADGDFEQLLVSIATSEAFRYRNVADSGGTP